MEKAHGSTLDRHIKDARASLEESKRKYYQDIAHLDELVEKKKALQSKELEEMFINSNRSYDEVLDFFGVNTVEDNDDQADMSSVQFSQNEPVQRTASPRRTGGKHCKKEILHEETEIYSESSESDNEELASNSDSDTEVIEVIQEDAVSEDSCDSYCVLPAYAGIGQGTAYADSGSQDKPGMLTIIERKKTDPRIILFTLALLISSAILIYSTIVTLNKHNNGNNFVHSTGDDVRTPVPNSEVFVAENAANNSAAGSDSEFQTATVGQKRICITDTEIDLSTCSAEEIAQNLNFICSMPNLQVIFLGDNFSSLGHEGAEMIRKNTDAYFSGNVQLYGKTVQLETRELDLSFIDITDEADQLKEVLPALVLINELRMECCGVSDEVMEEIRDSIPGTSVIWRVWFGDNNAYSCLTNNETILASKPSVYGALRNENTQSLKYCTSVKNLDLGYNSSLTDCSFISYMKGLEICVLSNTSVDSLESFRNCPKLKLLEIGNANISDLSPLSECKELEYLNVGMNSEITDYTPLYGLKNLKKLSVAGTINALSSVSSLEDALSGTGCIILKDLSYVSTNNNHYYTAIEGEWKYDQSGRTSSNMENAQSTGVSGLSFSDNYNLVRSVFNYDDSEKSYCTKENGF